MNFIQNSKGKFTCSLAEVARTAAENVTLVHVMYVHLNMDRTFRSEQ